MTQRMASVEEIAERLRGSPLVLMLDIDGTLCDIVEHASDARVPEETRSVLARLAERPDVCIALVTGRSAADARRMVAIEGIHIAANHGVERVAASGTESVAPGWGRAARSVRAAVADLARIPSDFAGTLIEDKHFTLTVHYRQLDPRRRTELRDAVATIAERHALRVADGKSVINVLPGIDVDKGDAVLSLVRECGGDGTTASVFFAGDDVTDEDAFVALARHAPHAVTVRVGNDATSTAAALRVAAPGDILALLQRVERDRA